MTPSVDDRLNSVLRALQAVVLPALPASAHLAREQVMLAMGHLQVIQAQRDATQGFESGELSDIEAMAREILAVEGDETGASARASLNKCLAADTGIARDRADAIRGAIDTLLVAAHGADDAAYHRRLAAVILPLGLARAKKDRAWFMPMGFDSGMSA